MMQLVQEWVCERVGRLDCVGFGKGSTYWYPRASMKRRVLPLMIAMSAISLDVTGRLPASGRSLNCSNHVCCGVCKAARVLSLCDVPLDSNFPPVDPSLSSSLIITSLGSAAESTVSEDPAMSPTSCRKKRSPCIWPWRAWICAP